MDKKNIDKILNILMVALMLFLVIFVYYNAVIMEKPFKEYYVLCNNGTKININTIEDIPFNCVDMPINNDLDLNITFTKNG